MIAIGRERQTFTKVTELAGRLGISPSALYRHLASRPDFPGGRRGPWKLRAVLDYGADKGLPWSDLPLRNLATRGKPRRDDAPLSRLHELKVLIDEEDLRRRRRANDELEAKLIDREDAALWVREKFLLIKSRLEAIPEQLAMELPPDLRPSIKEGWDNHIHLILLEIAGWKFESPS